MVRPNARQVIEWSHNALSEVELGALERNRRPVSAFPVQRGILGHGRELGLGGRQHALVGDGAEGRELDVGGAVGAVCADGGEVRGLGVLEAARGEDRGRRLIVVGGGSVFGLSGEEVGVGAVGECHVDFREGECGEGEEGEEADEGRHREWILIMFWLD